MFLSYRVALDQFGLYDPIQPGTTELVCPVHASFSYVHSMFIECDEFGYGIYGYGKPRCIARITFPEHPEAPNREDRS